MNKNTNNVDVEFAALKYFASKSKLLWERNRKKSNKEIWKPLIPLGLIFNIILSLLFNVIALS